MTEWESLEACAKQDEKTIYDLPPKQVFKACAGGDDSCLGRVRKVEMRLRKLFIGMEDPIRLMIASAIAQQPFLMIGPPGVAKTALATKFFELLGLRRPTGSSIEEGKGKAYFEYLLHSFSIPEEIYGPINIHLMRGEGGADPRVVRMNANMLTGPGVKACFLDEVFKANSAILNTLLTLINERRYFNDSVFKPSDLRVIFGASNQTPTVSTETGEDTGAGGSAVIAELGAFYDRWTVRAYVSLPEHDDLKNVMDSPYAEIREAALSQHWSRFHRATPELEPTLACINDILVLGRCLVPPPDMENEYANTVADPDNRFVSRMLELAVGLRRDEEHQLCSINPRKILYIEMVTRAHALLCGGPMRRPEIKHLAVYRHIWDNEHRHKDLADTVNNRIEYSGPLVE